MPLLRAAQSALAGLSAAHTRQQLRSPAARQAPLRLSRGLAQQRFRTFAAMTPAEKYLFDTNGFIIVPQVLSPDEVAKCQAAIDERKDQFLERTGRLRLGGNSPLAGDGTTGRQDLAGILGWKIPGGSPFRQLLAHPRLLPYIEEVCGKGYRMDHQPFILQQQAGAEGFVFHGGATDDNGNWDQALAYGFHHGRMYTPLLAMSLQLTDSAPGEGGFVVVRGSHKSNYPCPIEIKEYREHTEHSYQPAMKAGDVLLFSEALTHGTLPWTADRTRRVGLYRFSPAAVAYGRSYYPTWPKEFTEGMTPAELAVMEPPYHLRLDRPSPAEDGENIVTHEPRAGFKKEFDKKVFGTTYF